MAYSRSTQQGFSLVELSIVLVIIGLAVSAVFAGRHLLKQSELQEVIKEVSSLTSHVLAFRDKYSGPPGDLSSATLNWPSGNTANGNGNGHITNTGGPNGNENFRGWQQLALGGFLEGTYTGVAASGGNDYAIPGENIPATSFNNGAAGYTLDYTSGDVLILGGTKTNDKPLNSAFTPEEIAQLDKKLDDGQPLTGILIADDGADAPASCDTGTPEVYDFTNQEASCRLIYFYPLNDFTR